MNYECFSLFFLSFFLLSLIATTEDISLRNNVALNSQFVTGANNFDSVREHSVVEGTRDSSLRNNRIALNSQFVTDINNLRLNFDSNFIRRYSNVVEGVEVIEEVTEGSIVFDTRGFFGRINVIMRFFAAPFRFAITPGGFVVKGSVGSLNYLIGFTYTEWRAAIRVPIF